MAVLKVPECPICNSVMTLNNCDSCGKVNPITKRVINCTIARVCSDCVESSCKYRQFAITQEI